MLHATKWPPKADARWGGFRPPLWLLSSAFSYLYDTGQETDSPVSPQVGCGTKCFCPQSLSLNSRVQQLLCPFILLFLSRNKLNTLNPLFFFLFFFFLSSSLSSGWLRKLRLFRSTSKKLHKMKTDELIFGEFFLKFFPLFFLMSRKWDEKQQVQWSTSLKLTPSGQLHIQSSYKCPFKWPLIFFFLRCAHKVYTIVNAVQILQCHLATESPG